MIYGEMQDFGLTLDKFLAHAAKWYPDAEIVTARAGGENLRIGYGELIKRCLTLSATFEELGVRQGECVATLAWNTQAHLETWYAVMGMGAVCHTLNPRLIAHDLAGMLSQSKARLMVVSGDLLALAQKVAETASNIERIIVIDEGMACDTWSEGRAKLLRYDALMDVAPLVYEWGAFEETAPSGLCFTSGTTGKPKGVTYTHRSSYLHTLRLLQADTMAISGSDSILTVVPMFHANAWGLPFAAPAVGAKLVLPGRQTDGASLARLIEEENVTVAVGVPTVWLDLLDHVEKTGKSLPTIERIIVGGAPMPQALMERIEQGLGVVIQISWGMTELSPLGTVTPASETIRLAKHAGKPAIGVDLLLADFEGHPLPQQRNVEGHLLVRGVAVVERYFGQKEQATDSDGWFPTGDLARIDDEGRLMITGRSKDLIKSGGEWINPAKIEAVVGAIPEVNLVAVIGKPDPKWGERPVLLVEMRDSNSLSDEALLEPLRDRVASWWVPDSIVRLDVMPLAPTGKIDKQRLRAIYGID